ncbi:MAG: hypothetical protein WBI07_08670 [Mobilitalea sp.]
MGEIGELLGWLIIIGYTLTALNFVVKAVNKKFGKNMAKYPKFKKIYSTIMKILVKYHKLFGLSTIVFILAHFIVQYTSFGLRISGGVAAAVMILQILLGIYGAYVVKKRSGAWFILHRLIAVILLIVIAIHII